MLFEPLSDALVYVLCLGRGSHLACADSPDGLVGDDNAFPVGKVLHVICDDEEQQQVIERREKNDAYAFIAPWTIMTKLNLVFHRTETVEKIVTERKLLKRELRVPFTTGKL